MTSPLDEYPIHQAPVSMERFGTSDRNVYDRCIMQCFDRAGSVEMITGLGVYPHLGVIDAYAALRRGDHQLVVRSSDALGDNRMEQAVGPFRFEVVKPLRRLRVVCDAAAQGLTFDLEWEASFETIDEPRHITTAGTRTVLNASRFVQVGAWSGVMRADGQEIAVDHDGWAGTRDRSWGIRPSGEPTPVGRPPDDEVRGHWHVWAPLRFEDFCIFVVAFENPYGDRDMQQAVRVWDDSSGKRAEQLGWPEFEIKYRSGTRVPEAATIHLSRRGRSSLAVDIEPLTFVALHMGAGYGGGGEGWSHGRWMGRGWTDRADFDLADPELLPFVQMGLLDHSARALCDGAEGWGIFEHSTFGRHDPSGFADAGAVAP